MSRKEAAFMAFGAAAADVKNNDPVDLLRSFHQLFANRFYYLYFIY